MNRSNLIALATPDVDCLAAWLQRRNGPAGGSGHVCQARPPVGWIVDDDDETECDEGG